VILPEGTLERLERHSIGVAENADWLKSAGKHLKRGVLLYGPPDPVSHCTSAISR
jgi:hypothetical protein